MKPAGVILVLGVVLIGFVFVKIMQGYHADEAEDRKEHVNERPESKRWRWEKEAEQSQRQECTNSVVGFRRILESQTRTFDASVSKWTGSAKVEFINANGGVSVTNIPFRFLQHDDRVSCLLDESTIAHEDFERWKKANQ